MIDNAAFVSSINYENQIVAAAMNNQNLSDNEKEAIIEYSLVKMFVDLQCFISKCFEEYAVGGRSNQYTPQRRLNFESAEHLQAFFYMLKKQYVDSLETGIKEYSKHIFASGKDPFALIIASSEEWDIYNKALIIRNYISHKSSSASKDYVEKFFANKPQDLKSPAYVLKQMKNKESLYTTISKTFIKITQILIDPEPYF